MYWEDVGTNLVKEFERWRKWTEAENTPEEMMEFLAANGFIRLKFAAAVMEKLHHVDPILKFMSGTRKAMREGHLIPGVNIIPGKKAIREAEKAAKEMRANDPDPDTVVFKRFINIEHIDPL